jgi:hypothetical protein
MLSDAEKERILERLSFESDIRKELLKREPDKAKPWWESGLFLLLVGSAITALFVPWFESHHKNLDWQRQNRYDTNNFRLQTMRDCLRETVILNTFPAEANERFHRLMEKTSSPKEIGAFKTQFIDLQNRRFQQNAKTASTMLYFPHNEDVRDLFQKYIEKSGSYLRALELQVEACTSTGKCDQSTSSPLDQKLQEVDSLYQALVSKIKDEISAKEQDNEQFRL